MLVSGHGQLVGSGVPAGDPVEELPLDIQQKTRGSDPEHLVVQPVVPQLLLHHDQPGGGVLRCPELCEGMKG